VQVNVPGIFICPGGQKLQCEAFPSENWPSGQALHEEAPDLEYVLLGQIKQSSIEVAPTVAEALPAGQAVHKVCRGKGV